MTTELEAVNQMLSVIGQVPVQEISDDVRSDSRIALGVLREYTDELQAEGYDFNTFEGFEAEPSSVTKQITFSQSVRRVSNYYPYPRLTLRGNRLYNLDTQSYEHEGTQKVNIIQHLGFEDLPFQLKRYVVIRASRVFANRTVGAGEINAYSREDELRARIAWLDSYSDDMQLNVLSTQKGHRPRTSRPIDAIVRNGYGYN